jgi:phage terminase small subunit
MHYPLTDKQKAFAREYVANGENGTQAIMKTYGYKQKSASRYAYHLKKNPRISSLIQQTQDKIALKSGDAAEVVFDLMENARRDEVKLKAAQDVLNRSGIQNEAKRVDFTQYNVVLQADPRLQGD